MQWKRPKKGRKAERKELKRNAMDKAKGQGVRLKGKKSNGNATDKA